MYLAGALSRGYLQKSRSREHQHDAGCVPKTIYSPGIKQLTAKERVKFIKPGSPETKGELSHLVLSSFVLRDELSVHDDMVDRGERVVLSLRRDVTQRLHYAQSGVITSLSQAKECTH